MPKFIRYALPVGLLFAGLTVVAIGLRAQFMPGPAVWAPSAVGGACGALQADYSLATGCNAVGFVLFH